jgi:hypothetical protein
MTENTMTSQLAKVNKILSATPPTAKPTAKPTEENDTAVSTESTTVMPVAEKLKMIEQGRVPIYAEW